MSATMRQSPVARPPDQPGVRKEAISVTLNPAQLARLSALKAATGQSASKIIAAALDRSLPAFENDPGELLRAPTLVEQPQEQAASSQSEKTPPAPPSQESS